MKRIIIALLSGLIAFPTFAQRVEMVAANQRSLSGTPIALEMPVTAAFHDMSMKQALAVVAKQSGVLIQYQSHLLDGMKTVSLQADSVALGQVLKQMLAGTKLYPVVVARDVVTIRATAQLEGEEGTLKGRIVNASTSKPIAGATVSIKGQSTALLTDRAGSFQTQLMAGAYTITIRALGFVRDTRTLQVTGADTVLVEIALQPNTNVLNEVVVTGTVIETARKEIPTPVTVITAQDIERRGITRIEQLFRGDVPGLFVLDRGTTAFKTQTATVGNHLQAEGFARGSSDLSGNGALLKTYIDGVELLDQSYLGTIDPQSIERIEIVTGPQAATIYGSGAIGGVMQIFTKKGSAQQTPEVTLGIRYGILQNNLSSGLTPSHHDIGSIRGGLGTQFSYSATASHTYTGQWRPMLFARSYGGSLGATYTQGPVSAAAAVSQTYTSNGTYNGDADGSIGFASGRETGQFRPNVGGTGGASQRILRSMSQTTSLNVDYRTSSLWQHHLTIGNNISTQKDDPVAAIFTRPRDSLLVTTQNSGARLTVGYNTTVMYTVADRFHFVGTIGMNASKGEQLLASGCQVGERATAWTGCGSGFMSEPRVNQTLSDDSYGGFGNFRLGVYDRLFFTVGLRGERNSAYGKEHSVDWTPTNGLTYTFEFGDATVKLQGSYGRATRAPNPEYATELAFTAPLYSIPHYISRFASPNLTPEYSQGPQGGVEFYYGSWGSITVNHYQQTVSDLIQAVYIDSFTNSYVSDGREIVIRQYMYQNVGTLEQFGWEGTGTLNYGFFSLKGSYSWNESRITYSNSISQIGRSFAGVPTHFGSLTVSYAHQGTSVNVFTNYVGSYLNDRDLSPLEMRLRGRLAMYTDTRKPTGTIRQSAYSKSDVSVSQMLTPTISATLNITNLANSFDSDYGAFLNPSLGRQTMVGLSLRL